MSSLFRQLECGCPIDVYTYPYHCEAHAARDGRVRIPHPRRAESNAWYSSNTCPFCGRVTPAGLACATATAYPCGVVSCASHGQAHYRLGTACAIRECQRRVPGRHGRRTKCSGPIMRGDYGKWRHVVLPRYRLPDPEHEGLPPRSEGAGTWTYR